MFAIEPPVGDTDRSLAILNSSMHWVQPVANIDTSITDEILISIFIRISFLIKSNVQSHTMS